MDIAGSETYEGQPQQPLTEVREFVTRMWFHPLVSSETLAFRKDGLSLIKKRIDFSQLYGKCVFVAHGGGFLWGPGENSDYDFLMLHEDARDAAAIVGRDGKVLKETGLDMYPILSGDWQRYEGFVWKILLTPDEYAVGDFDLLAERRQFFANLARNSLGWNDRQIKAQFEEAIRGWPELSGRKGADRMMRYWDFLDKRFNNQETRRERFNHKREVFRLPQIETFYQAMTESKGKLTMLPQYALQGIDLSKEELVGEIRELQREVVVNPG